MTTMIKKFLRPFVPDIVLSKLKKSQQEKLYDEWKRNGCPAPPPHIVKQKTIKEYQEKFKYSVLVETGTALGEMVDAQKDNFKKIYSIELGVELFEKAKKRFKNDKNITIVQGDSGKVLPNVLSEINEPAIFWLDGHYSAGVTAKGDTDCPIFDELESIFNSKKFNHVLLIDDARLFNGHGDYPSIEKLTEFIKNRNSNYQLEVKDDIIRYTILNSN
jgi:hypothetical protein